MKQLSTRLSNQQDLGKRAWAQRMHTKDGDAKVWVVMATGRLGQLAREKHRRKANHPDAFEYQALLFFYLNSSLNSLMPFLI